MDFLPLVAWLLGGVCGGERWKNVGGRCEALTIKEIHGGTGFGAEMTCELFSGQGGNLTAEMEIDRLWGIPGGFLDLVAVIIEMEDGL